MTPAPASPLSSGSRVPSPWAPRAAPGEAPAGGEAPAPGAPTGPSPAARPPAAFGEPPPRTVPAPGAPSRPPLADTAGRPAGVGPRPPTSWPGPPAPEVAPARSVPARQRLAIAALGALAGALVLGLVFAGYVIADRRGPADRSAQARTGDLDIRRILRTAQPSVVSIQTGEAQSLYGSAGSGVVISDDGLVLTNNHVIEGAGAIQVQFDDGAQATAQLVGASAGDDIALIRVDRADTVPAKIGSSDALRVGDDVVAIGNALNLGSTPSVTRGIVSAKDRSISTPDESLDHLIQTDAAINQGNSGGPLINAEGEVVGINTAIIRDAQNVGFSIAIDSLKPLIEDLKQGRGSDTAASEGAFLGVNAVDVDSPDLDQSVRDRFGVSTSRGAFVTSVAPGTAADAAGIQQGDVIVEVDGRDINGSDDVTDAMRERRPGDRSTITVERDGKRRSFDVTLRKRGG